MANKLPCILLFFLSLLFLSITTVLSRSLSKCMPFGILSDGVRPHRNPQHIVLNPLSLVVDAELPPCKQTYGFMPCSTTALGNLFLIVVYGYLIFMAAKYLTNGSELLELLGPGILGNVVLPKLGGLPSAMLILASGLSERKEIAQGQISIGMGLLAGSSVLLTTLVWGSCVVIGKCDIDKGSKTRNGCQNKKGFSLTEIGVTTHIWTCYAARVMVISVIPFIVVQITQILTSTSGKHLTVLIALIVSVLIFIAYSIYQDKPVNWANLWGLLRMGGLEKGQGEFSGWGGAATAFHPWIKEKWLAYAKHRHLISGFLKHLRNHALGKLLNDRGEPDKDVIKKSIYLLALTSYDRLFDGIDENKDGELSRGELKALIIGIKFDEINLDKDDAADKLLKDFDSSRDNQINSDEFYHGISKWLNEVNREKRSGDPGSQTEKLLGDFHEQTKREHDLLGADEQIDEVVENPKWTSFKAYSMLVIGTIISTAVANPLKDTVINLSNATTIPSFFISFIALPLATKLSDVIPILIYASRKSKNSASLTFNELYRTVSVNNVIHLSVFLAVVYIRGLRWEFSSEMLVILIVCIVMGGFASFRTTFPLWTSLVAYILYPFSLALIYVLDYDFGWP
ncbi:hypothetical protein Pint_04679 [Pistacia integerrima]|uniref:Uncharacterized protein n=1 Tax=Pistacia integerrima TaxID=434235 RepID=A0ACC0Z2X4_9ROSI|nr:hypothetical protein Pint_04679 [Pistacia integerrima]